MTHLYLFIGHTRNKGYVVYFITDITSHFKLVRGLLVGGNLFLHRNGASNEMVQTSSENRDSSDSDID